MRESGLTHSLRLPTGYTPFNASENQISPTVAEACGVTELTTMISSESGKCGAGVGLAVAVTARLGRGVGVEVRLGVAGVSEARSRGVAVSGAGTSSGFWGWNVSAASPASRSAAPVIHQPASTRWRRWRK